MLVYLDEVVAILGQSAGFGLLEIGPNGPISIKYVEGAALPRQFINSRMIWTGGLLLITGGRNEGMLTKGSTMIHHD